MSGTLYVVATPIGNLGDISARAIETLKSVDAIAAENPRHHLKLLNHLEMKKRILECSPANEKNSAPGIVKLLEQGQNIALVSDAGVPLLSDPGRMIVDTAISAGIEVIPVPGPSALTALLSVSGFSSNPFIFLGFLPKKEGKASKMLKQFCEIPSTIVLFCSHYHLKKTLQMIYHIFENAEIIIGREMTKLNEEYLRGSVSELLEAEITPKGEFTIAVNNFKKVRN